MQSIVLILVLLLTAFGWPGRSEATIWFNLEQTKSTVPETFGLTLGFDDQALQSGYHGYFDYFWNAPPNGPIPAWDFGNLKYVIFDAGVKTTLATAPSVCGNCDNTYYAWTLSVDWNGGSSLPSIAWFYNSDEWDFRISGAGDQVAGYFNTQYSGFNECHLTGKCRFKGRIAVAEPVSLGLVGIGLGMIGLGRNRRYPLFPSKRSRK